MAIEPRTVWQRTRRTVAGQLDRPLTANSYFLMASSVQGALLGFLFWAVAARAYGPAQVGLGVATISAATLVSTLALVGLDTAVIRYAGEVDDRARLVDTALTTPALLAVGLALAALGLFVVTGSALATLASGAAPALAFVAGAAAYTVFVVGKNAFIAARDTKYAFLQNLTLSLAKIAFVVALAPLLGAFGIYGAWALAAGLAVALSLVWFLPKALPGYHPRPRLSRTLLARMVRFSAGNHLVNLARVGTPLLLPIVVLTLLGAAESAYFYVAYAITAPLLIIPESFSLSLLAEGSHAGHRFAGALRSALGHTAVFLVPGVAAVVLLADVLLSLFGASYAEAAGPLLGVMALAALPAALNYFYTTQLRVEHRTAELVLLNAAIFASVVGGTIVLLRATDLGLLGVGLAWAGTYTLAALYTGVQLARAALRPARPA